MIDSRFCHRRIFVHEKSVAEAQDLEKALEAEGDYKSEAVAICKHCSNEKLNNYVINSKNYFNLCAEALDNYKFTIFSNYLKVGRLVVMNFSSMQNTLGVLLEVQKDRSLEILTSVDGKCGYEEITVAAKSDSCDRLPLYDEFPNFFGQDFTPCLVKCRYSQLLQITKYSVDLTQSAAQSVIDSFEKRAKYQRIPFPFSKAVFETLTLVSDCLKTAKSNNETISIDVLALFTNKNKTLKQHELYEQVLSSLHLLERNGRTTQCGLFLEHAKLFNQKLEKRRELEKLRESMSDETLQNYDHYQERREILRKSKYLDQHGKLTLKGKVACQISVQEILITEAVFANLFENLTAPEIAAFLSIFVYQGPSSEELDIKKFVENITVKKAIYRMLHLRAEFMANVAIKSFGIPSYGDICVNLVDTVFLFASQASYEEIIKSVDRMEELGAKPVLEGDIVRCLQRVEYLVRELLAMAFIIGDQNLAARFGEVRQAFKSELVFVNSLYLQSWMLAQTSWWVVNWVTFFTTFHSQFAVNDDGARNVRANGFKIELLWNSWRQHNSVEIGSNKFWWDEACPKQYLKPEASFQNFNFSYMYFISIYFNENFLYILQHNKIYLKNLLVFQVQKLLSMNCRNDLIYFYKTFQIFGVFSSSCRTRL